MRGGPERTRTACQARSHTNWSLRHRKLLGSQDSNQSPVGHLKAAGKRNFTSRDKAAQTGVSPSRTGLETKFEGASSAIGAVLSSSPSLRAPRDPAPPACWPRWGFGGAAQRRHKPNGGFRCQSLLRSVRPNPPRRERRLQKLHSPPKPILARRTMRAQSKLASSRCFNRRRGR
jgi:hypothetical protein